MADIIGTLINRDPRYYVKNGAGLCVRLTRKGDEDSHVTAELIDISVGGAKLKVAEPPHIKDVLSVEIETAEPQQRIAVIGDVCWVSPAADGQWLFGCSFRPKVPANTLVDFAASGMLERRQHVRQVVSHVAKAERELDGQLIDVEILDYSRGGFSVRSNCQCEPGDRLLLRLQAEDGREVEILGKTQWRFAVADDFTNGCGFVRDQDFVTMKRILGHPTKSRVSPSLGQQLWWRSRGEIRYRSPEQKVRRFLIAMGMLTVLAGFGWTWHHFRSTSEGTITPTEVQFVSSAPAGNLPVDLPRATVDLQAKHDSQPTTPLNVDAAASDGRTHDLAQEAVFGSVVTEGAATERVQLSPPTKSLQESYLVDDLEPQEPTSNDGFRLWTDITGRYQVIARLESIEDGLVRLRKRNGESASAPIHRLSSADADFVRQWQTASVEPTSNNDSVISTPVDTLIE